MNRPPHMHGRIALRLGSLLLSLAGVPAANPVGASPQAMPAIGRGTPGTPTRRVDFRGTSASRAVRQVAEWALASADNRDMPFIIIDKVNARAFVFDAHGALLDATAILLGLARGDASPAGIGSRKLADIGSGERITPAGSFLAAIGHDLGPRDILWIDYDAGISLHRVFTGTPSERRLQRLATATPLDNRISYGCINVPTAFYDAIIGPTFKATSGLVYILPEVKSLHEVFGPFGLNAIPD